MNEKIEQFLAAMCGSDTRSIDRPSAAYKLGLLQGLILTVCRNSRQAERAISKEIDSMIAHVESSKIKNPRTTNDTQG